MMTEKTPIFSDPKLAGKIKSELIDKSYYDDVKYNIQSKYRWKIIGDITETASHILTGLSAILAFSSGFFDNTMLSFVAGCVATLSLIFRQFSSYSMKESKERTDQVNRVLNKLGIEEIVDITVDSTNESARLSLVNI